MKIKVFQKFKIPTLQRKNRSLDIGKLSKFSIQQTFPFTSKKDFDELEKSDVNRSSQLEKLVRANQDRN